MAGVIFVCVAVFLEQGVERNHCQESGWCRARPGVKGIQAGELELRHLSCNGNQNNRKDTLFSEEQPGWSNRSPLSLILMFGIGS